MSSDLKSGHRQQRGVGAILIEFLGSMNLAITLLVVIAIAAIIGTVLQQNEPYQNYIMKFGPFWFELFKKLGLFDIYGAGWFMGLLGFLLLSTAVCVYRNTPVMLRDMNHFRLDVQQKSLRAFHHSAEWVANTSMEESDALVKRYLNNQGYKVKDRSHGDHRVIAGMRGASSRLGYIFSHLAIVVICIGGLIDGNPALKFAEWRGEVLPETRNVAVSQVREESVIGPENHSFRGSVSIPEGGSADFVFLGLRDGYLVQQLPFSVELKDFRIEHYPSGQPKSFESDLVIHDQDLKEPLAQTIAVNYPLIYKGYAIYQASFADGGSSVDLRLWSLDDSSQPTLSVAGKIGDSQMIESPRGPLRLELDEFKLFNIFPEEDQSLGKKFRNYGPSVTFRLRKANGEALEYLNYMLPVSIEGRDFMMTGMRSTPAENFRYLYIPVDSRAGVERFQRFRERAMDEAVVRAVVKRQTQASLQSMEGDLAAMEQRITDSIVTLLGLFMREGVDAVAEQAKRQAPDEEQQQQAMDSYVKVIQGVLSEIYLEQLAGEGVDIAQGLSDADSLFFDDALNAYSLMGPYGSPYFLQLANFEHREASGLQITRSPGKDIVYLGCVLLMVGIFMMFYLHHRRVWVWLAPTSTGTEILFAGSGNRNRVNFDEEFSDLHQGLSAVVSSSATTTDT